MPDLFVIEADDRTSAIKKYGEKAVTKAEEVKALIAGENYLTRKDNLGEIQQEISITELDFEEKEVWAFA